MTYPVAFRKLVLQKRSQMSYRKLAALYGISVNAIRRWEQELEPRKYRGTPSKINSDRLRQDVADYPDDYYFERAARLGCSKQGIGHAMRRLGLTRKKRA